MRQYQGVDVARVKDEDLRDMIREMDLQLRALTARSSDNVETGVVKGPGGTVTGGTVVSEQQYEDQEIFSPGSDKFNVVGGTAAVPGAARPFLIDASRRSVVWQQVTRTGTAAGLDGTYDAPGDDKDGTAIDCSAARTGMFYAKIDSTGAPTKIILILKFDPGNGEFYEQLISFWANNVHDDTEVATEQAWCWPFDCNGADNVLVRVETTGTSGGVEFEVSDSYITVSD